VSKSHTASELLTMARDILERADAVAAGVWPRTTAFLTRQALEAAIDQFWLTRVPAMNQCSTRARLLALPYYTQVADLGPQVQLTWTMLSRACHYRAYELPPTAVQLRGWVDKVAWVIARV